MVNLMWCGQLNHGSGFRVHVCGGVLGILGEKGTWLVSILLYGLTHIFDP